MDIEVDIDVMDIGGEEFFFKRKFFFFIELLLFIKLSNRVSIFGLFDKEC